MFYAAAAVVKPGLFAGIRARSVTCLQPSLAAQAALSNFLQAYVIRQHVVCHSYHLLVIFYFSDCAWTVNNVFCWAARGEGVVVTLPGSAVFQLRYGQQIMSLLYALAFPKYKKGGYFIKSCSVEDLWVEKHRARHYYHFWPREFQCWQWRCWRTDALHVWVQFTVLRCPKWTYMGILIPSVCPPLSRFPLAEEMVRHHHLKITNKQVPYNF